MKITEQQKGGKGAAAEGTLRAKLAGKWSLAAVRELCRQIEAADDDGPKEQLLALATDEEPRLSYNALWVCTQLPPACDLWLESKRDVLTELVMRERRDGHRRLLLTLLLRLRFEADDLQTDLLDFCLAQITACTAPSATRALCIKLAYAQCRHYAELQDELAMILDMMSAEPLPTWVQAVRKEVLGKMQPKRPKGESV